MRQLIVAAPVSVPALYAWGVTVLPLLSINHLPRLAFAAAVAAPTILLVGAALEHSLQLSIRSFCLWGFTLACAMCWLSVASISSPLLDRGYTTIGVLAWGMLALVWAAPPLGPAHEPAKTGIAVSKADSFPSGIGWAALLGIAAAIVLQVVAVESENPERALLGRLILVTGGIVAVGLGSRAALAQFAKRKPS